VPALMYLSVIHVGRLGAEVCGGVLLFTHGKADAPQASLAAE